MTTLLPYLDYFAAVIIGPGPGSPERPEEIGIINDLWRVSDEHLIPIFGVCLGLQSLGLEYGARLKRLNVVKHGQISRIHHGGVEIFKGVGDVDAVRYHSLHVELAVDGELEQLGWSDDGEENGRVVMALKHKYRPFWAVQYHPESVRTEGGGRDVISNFWRLAANWSKVHSRKCRPWTVTVQKIIGQSWPQLHTHPSECLSTKPTATQTTVTTVVLNLPDLTTIAICEKFGVSDDSTPFVLLDSAAKPGRFTIIGAFNPCSPKISYFVGDSFVSVTEDSGPVHKILESNNIWNWLAAFMRNRKAQGGCPDIPFWGGLVGYLSYELGVQCLSVPPRPDELKRNRHPDVNLVFVERSIVRDSITGNVYIQSLIPDDDKWIQGTAALLKCIISSTNVAPFPMKHPPTLASPMVTLPKKDSYIARIHSAKEHLFAGNSYELCVTAPTRIVYNKPSSSSPSSSWELYKILRAKNPAPHSAYLRLHPSTLLSSSPERFLSYSRGPGTICQLRPIKGTLRKGPGVTRAIAEQALARSKKEIAENLMIVDLIRHDLHGVVGEDVKVTKFCGLEECQTVWSLVSVIEGRVPTDTINNTGLGMNGELGWDVLSRSLPPGKYSLSFSFFSA